MQMCLIIVLDRFWLFIWAEISHAPINVCVFVYVGFFNPPPYGVGNTSSLSLERSGISGSVPTQFYMPGQLPSVALFCGSLSCVCPCTSLLQEYRWRLECSWLAVKASAGLHCLSVIPLKMQRFLFYFNFFFPLTRFWL